ncbi:hypothetical protein JJC00_19790 [Bradyrhizobium diazoefficiens]|uniref:hypothetical protein n=1 Tax=Bradyrhizobium diazoefficiens TaxID=1355477 RepID=UPI00190D9DF2|nr:hypothetical protein [Bradyrhizobium diazoefficiens]QQO30916.1 hypothetical protein JJC00_19790 [Bradyrhizobium diazoefficiens]
MTLKFIRILPTAAETRRQAMKLSKGKAGKEPRSVTFSIDFSKYRQLSILA